MKTACPLPRAAINSPSARGSSGSQSNETLALSQYGQATFTSLQTFLQGTVSTLLYDPAPTPLGWRSWFGAFYAEDAIRLTPRLHCSHSVSATNLQRVERGARARRPLTPSPTAVISDAADHRQLGIHREQRRSSCRNRALGLAWSPFGKTRATVIRAGFGMYNDLQDALGYRTDQNAPFNPTYSPPNFARFASFPSCRRARCPPARNWCRAACSRICRRPR